jgi:hypothetical protein
MELFAERAESGRTAKPPKNAKKAQLLRRLVQTLCVLLRSIHSNFRGLFGFLRRAWRFEAPRSDCVARGRRVLAPLVRAEALFTTTDSPEERFFGTAVLIARAHPRRRSCQSSAPTTPRNAGCPPINLNASAVSDFPGSIRGHVDAPEGCGNAMRSIVLRPTRTDRMTPICSTNGRAGRNCSIASLPTGTIKRGRKISISCCSHGRQRSISSKLGTRSPPFGFFPGKQRHTAAM